MLLFRSLSVGLLGACFLLLAMRAPARVRVVHVHDRDHTVIYKPAPAAVTVVDAVTLISAEQLGSLVRLAPGEQVTAVGDHPVSGSVAAGVALAALHPHAMEFVDLTIAGAHGGERRVVLLLH